MSLMLTIVIFCLLLLLLFVKYVIPVLQRHRQLLSDYQTISFLPLSSIPFVGNAHQFDKRPEGFFRLLSRLTKQCQDQNQGLFCLWFGLSPRIFLCSGQGLESFISNSRQLVKSQNYTFLEPWLGTGLLTSNHEKWRGRRRLITPSFHDTQLLHNFIEIFNKQSKIFVNRLRELANEEKKTHDLFPYISACTLDIIAETATGTHPNAQLSDQNNDFVEATVRMFSIISLRARSPWLWPIFTFDRSSIGKEQKKLLEILHRFTREVIEERLSTLDVEEEKRKTRRLVFLDSLIDQMHAGNLSLSDVQEEVDTFMFEGHDTTATALLFCCYLVGSHPDVQEKIHQEIDSIFGDDYERDCTTEDIEQMTYLNCVIKEAMRICPPVAQVSRKTQEDFQYCGQTIRKDTTVMIYIYGIHHDANVFPHLEKFDPERFADENLHSMEISPYAYIPFSAGSRNCIGQRFALIEEKIVLSHLFRHFSFRSTQTFEQIHLANEGLLRTKIPIEMIIEKRNLR